MRASLAAAAVAGGVVAGGWTPTTAPPDVTPGVVSPLPLDGYVYRDPADRRAVAVAVQVLADRCMAARGFDYEPPPVDVEHASPAVRYGLADLSRARAHGYHHPPGQEPPDPVPEADLLPGDPAVRAAFLVALRGSETPSEIVEAVDPVTGEVVPTYYRGGCLAEAEQRVFGDWPTYAAVRSSLDVVQIDAHGAAAESSAVRQALAAGRTCMASEGHDVDDPYELLARPWPVTVSAAEVRTAVADVRCKQESRLVEAWSAEEAEAQRRLLDGREYLVEEFERRWAIAVANAEATLAGDASS